MICLARKNAPKSGLSRIDLIASTAIVSLLGLFSLPALAQAVDDAKAKQCDRRMAALGKTIANYRARYGYHQVVSTEPVSEKPGLTGTKEPGKPSATVRRTRPQKPAHTGYSWLFDLLPLIGEEALHRRTMIRSRENNSGPFDPALRATDDDQHVATVGIKELQCPAFAERDADYRSAAPEYLAIIRQWRKADGLSEEQAPGIALTNYVATSATHLDLVLPEGDKKPEPNGVIAFSDKRRGPIAIPDGDANTIIVAETREPFYASWIDGTTAWVVAHDPNSKPPVRDGASWKCEKEDGCRHAINVGPEMADGKDQKVFYRAKWAGEDPWRFGPSSKHAGGRVNHLFADGAVRAIYSHGEREIDATVYLALVTTNGREEVKRPE